MDDKNSGYSGPVAGDKVYGMRYGKGILLSLLLMLAISCQAEPPQDGDSAKPAEVPTPPTSAGTKQRAAHDTERQVASSGIVSASFGLPLGSLPPEMQQSLERIKVLRLRDDIVDVVWRLKNSKGAYGAIVLDCSPEVLSTSRIKAIVDWAKKGNALFIQGRHIELFSRQLHPSSYSLYILTSYGGPTLVHRGRLVRDVSKIANYLWCPTEDYKLTFKRQSVGESERSPGPKSVPLPDTTENLLDSLEPRRVFSANGGSFEPVLVDEHRPDEAYFLLASTY